MGRYIYKPLIAYFDGDSEEKKKEFLEKYKESLKTGELLVDLYNYDIYVSNSGLEYPIPVTSEIREEIINWIESEEGPLSQYKINGLINEKSTDSSESSLIRKQELIESLKNKIIEYQNAFIGNTSEDENILKRTLRECQYFYKDLGNYTLTLVNGSPNYETDNKRIYGEIVVKYFSLFERFKKLRARVNSQINTLNNLSNEIYPILNEKYREVVNMGVSLNSKLDKKITNMEPPVYKITIEVHLDHDINKNEEDEVYKKILLMNEDIISSSDVPYLEKNSSKNIKLEVDDNNKNIVRIKIESREV